MTQSDARSISIRRIVGAAIGVVLLGAAIFWALSNADGNAFRRASPTEVVGLAGLVLLNHLLTGVLFEAVTRSFPLSRRVGIRHMTALLAVSALLNYIPVIRAGLWGRAVFLRRYHGLSLADSGRVLVVVLLLAVLVVGGVGAILLAVDAQLGWWLTTAWLSLLGFAIPRLTRRWIAQTHAGIWAWLPIRAADLGVAAARLWLAYRVVGVDLSLREAIVFAAASLLIKLSGLTPNGLGLSEWVVAGLTAALTPIEAAAAATAVLIDRGVEVITTVLLGLPSWWWLQRWAKRHGKIEPGSSGVG